VGGGGMRILAAAVAGRFGERTVASAERGELEVPFGATGKACAISMLDAGELVPGGRSVVDVRSDVQFCAECSPKTVICCGMPS
jgi:hypothetical protein